MKTKLHPYTFNAKKWRIENGYTTPEWQIYIENMIFKTICIAFLYFITGVVLTVIAIS